MSVSFGPAVFETGEQPVWRVTVADATGADDAMSGGLSVLGPDEAPHVLVAPFESQRGVVHAYSAVDLAGYLNTLIDTLPGALAPGSERGKLPNGDPQTRRQFTADQRRRVFEAAGVEDAANGVNDGAAFLNPPVTLDNAKDQLDYDAYALCKAAHAGDFEEVKGAASRLNILCSGRYPDEDEQLHTLFYSYDDYVLEYDEETPLIHAIMWGNLAMVIFLLTSGTTHIGSASVNNDRLSPSTQFNLRTLTLKNDSPGWFISPLKAAIQTSQVRDLKAQRPQSETSEPSESIFVIGFLLHQGANAMARDRNGATAIHTAVELHKPEALEVILLWMTRGPVAHAWTSWESLWTPLDVLTSGSDEWENGQKILNHELAWNPLHTACALNCVECATILLKYKACDVAETCEDGETVLFAAVRAFYNYGDVRLAHLVLAEEKRRGVRSSPNTKNENPLDVALWLHALSLRPRRGERRVVDNADDAVVEVLKAAGYTETPRSTSPVRRLSYS